MHPSSFTALILDTLIKGTLLLALTWCATLALRKRSAAARHMVHVFALGALLLLPALVWVTPEWRIAGLPSFAAEIQPVKVAPALQPVVAATAAPVVEAGASMQAKNEAKPKHAASIAARPQRIEPKIASASAQQAVNAVSDKTAVSAPLAEKPITQWKSYLPASLLALWMSGVLLVLLRWRMNAARVAALVRRATVVTHSGWNAEIRNLSSELGLEREVVLMASRELEVPITTGSVIPRIILPPDHCEWSATRRDAILKHELAHIKRRDTLTHAVAQIAAAIYWFHPLVWLTVRAIRAERERACDDQVLSAGMKASDYAHELLDIVSGLREPELAAALAMARRSQLEGRVLAVLNPALPRSAVSRKTALGLAVLTVAIVVPLAALRPAGQASTPAAKQSSASKPSPASTSEISTAKPAAAALQASTPAAASSKNDDAEPAEAPEPPEVLAAEEASRAAEAAVQSVPAVPGVPAVPATPAVPGVPAVPAVPGGPPVPGGELSLCGSTAKLHNMNMETHDGDLRKWTATWQGDDCALDLHALGDIKFNAEATEIQGISQGGFFEINLRQGANLKQVRVTPSGSGLQYVYKFNGTQQPFEGETRTWFSQLLLQLERTTGFAADMRVPALLAKGGPTAVLDEINNLQGDYVRGRYFRKLLEQPNLPAPIVLRVIKQSSDQIHSDYELARVLMTVGKEYDLPDEPSRTAFLNAAGKLNSDYEHSRVLIELLRRPNISKENVRLGLGSAATLKSDYEKSRVLLSLTEQKAFEQAELDPYLKLVASIQSDYEKSRDLLAPLQKYKLTQEQINRIMDTVAGMNTDYEKSRLLLALAKQGKFDEAQMSNYLKVVDSMHSDYERSRDLLELMQNNTLSPASVSRAMENISKASSDYEKSRVLTTLVKANKFDETQMGTYLKVIDSMGTDYERSRSLLALMETNKLSTASIGKVIDAVKGIKTGYEKSRVLQKVAQNYQLEGALRESYIKAADSISSDYERTRAMAAVVKRATL
ncbi:MAG TPA: M56 family metallopeptidase [Candidatus Limnocylindrales bacterium]|nr:M56 family metallopeptidase [Candidatus Limnocylindrales bacterium]